MVKATLPILAVLLFTPLAGLHAADSSRDLLGERGLPRILFNNDSDDLKFPAYPEHHSALWVPAGDPVPLKGIASLEDYLGYRIGPLAKTAATGLAYCGNFGAPIWELRRDHIAALGDDPMQPIVGFWRKEGRTFFFSMRMNDMHHSVWNWAHLWDDFTKAHRHWFLHPPTESEWQKAFLPWLEDKTKPGPNEWWAKVQTKPEFLRSVPASNEVNRQGLLYDYAKADVRAHYLDVLREACRRYDLDGVELDWLRYPLFFRAGEVNISVMTEFVSEVRAILDSAAEAQGHPVRLVTRVPDAPARAKELGLDVGAWLSAGWIDAVIAGNGYIFGTNELDQWVALAHRHHVPVYGVIERMSRGFARWGTPETLRAAAATLWARGADGLYLFNYYNIAEYPLLSDLSDPARLAHQPKEFFVDACRDSNNGTVTQTALPLPIQGESSAGAVLLLTEAPDQAKGLRLELAFKSSGELAAPGILINGQRLEDVQLDRNKASFTAVSASPLEKGESHLTVSSSSPQLAKLLRRGVNEFSFTTKSAATLTSLSVRVEP